MNGSGIDDGRDDEDVISREDGFKARRKRSRFTVLDDPSRKHNRRQQHDTPSAKNETEEQSLPTATTDVIDFAPKEKENEGRHDASAVQTPILLSDEQQHILNVVINQRRSVFFTGPAGTGKSLLLREIIKRY